MVRMVQHLLISSHALTLVVLPVATIPNYLECPLMKHASVHVGSCDLGSASL